MKRKRLRFHQVSGGYSQTEIPIQYDFQLDSFEGKLTIKGIPEIIVNLKNVTCVEIKTLESEE